MDQGQRKSKSNGQTIESGPQPGIQEAFEATHPCLYELAVAQGSFVLAMTTHNYAAAEMLCDVFHYFKDNATEMAGTAGNPNHTNCDPDPDTLCRCHMVTTLLGLLLAACHLIGQGQLGRAKQLIITMHVYYRHLAHGASLSVAPF